MTTPVAAPGDTDLDDIVEVEPQTVLPPVPWTTRAVVDGVVVSLPAVDAVQVVARGPGEIGGAAVAISVLLHNDNDSDSGAPIVLDAVTVTATDRTGAPLSSLAAHPAAPFDGTLAPGGDARATYVFSLTGAAAPLSITVNPTPETAVAVFTGVRIN